MSDILCAIVAVSLLFIVYLWAFACDRRCLQKFVSAQRIAKTSARPPTGETLTESPARPIA
ncbi:hypothetical protein AciX9_4100 (plasmid) [Granulicella tundricola MP5ACTX9]|uniref:Uncharacterized protein n=1 Tax=Granulicella tundricola (strain ATCC BAA-1859 / DSM 23138 / MP5ACTX9) TaxID=1198114 RepID=E8X5Z6_GRATM|nr:hypothetical protein AciX9_4100 [Granulicella tundricola MP5ACTX9]